MAITDTPTPAQEKALQRARDAQVKEQLKTMHTIGPSELGKLIGRSTKCIQIDASRRPDTLPPRFVVPGTRKVLWRVVDVAEWMDGLAQVEQERRQREREFAKKMGLTNATYRRKQMTLAHKDNARAANALIAARKKAAAV